MLHYLQPPGIVQLQLVDNAAHPPPLPTPPRPADVIAERAGTPFWDIEAQRSLNATARDAVSPH